MGREGREKLRVIVSVDVWYKLLLRLATERIEAFIPRVTSMSTSGSYRFQTPELVNHLSIINNA